MAYAKIENLYRNTNFIDLFKNVYVLEKIHGSSAHIEIQGNNITFFAGGESHSRFTGLFDQDKLKSIYDNSSFIGRKIIFYGEVFGGKCQGMSDTYGKELDFVVFDVRVDDFWLDVPDAYEVALSFGLSFVWHEKVENTVNNLDLYRDQPSQMGIAKGNPDKKSEGIVVKPIFECYDKNGYRHIYKHKRNEFREVKTPRTLDGAELAILSEADEVASEWVTTERIRHILSKSGFPAKMENIGQIIRAITQDIKDESVGEIDWTNEKAIIKSISRLTVDLFKKEYL